MAAFAKSWRRESWGFACFGWNVSADIPTLVCAAVLLLVALATALF
jgi:hypothetical protein